MTMPPTKIVKPSPKVEEARAAIIAAVLPFKNDISPQELVAITAYTLGQFVAGLDQRRYTPEMAMKLVGDNIQMGNRAYLEAFAAAGEPSRHGAN